MPYSSTDDNNHYQVASSSLVVIGGSGAWSLVTEYSGFDEDEPWVLNRHALSRICGNLSQL